MLSITELQKVPAGQDVEVTGIVTYISDVTSVGQDANGNPYQKQAVLITDNPKIRGKGTYVTFWGVEVGRNLKGQRIKVAGRTTKYKGKIQVSTNDLPELLSPTPESLAPQSIIPIVTAGDPPIQSVTDTAGAGAQQDIVAVTPEELDKAKKPVNVELAELMKKCILDAEAVTEGLGYRSEDRQKIAVTLFIKAVERQAFYG